MTPLPHLRQIGRELFVESLAVYWGLLKIMVPVMVLVEAGTRIGLVEMLSDLCEPVMAFVGLPAETAIVLATNLVVGLYAAGAVLVSIQGDVSLTIGNMTVLAGMMLFAHALPVEVTIVKKAGCSLLVSLLTRLGAAFLYGWLLHLIYRGMDGFNEPATILIAAGTDNGDGSWISWIQSSAIGLFWIYWVLLFLIVFLRILKETGVTDFLTRMLTPVLRLIGIGPNAAPLAMVGILLGLSFGGALILREIQKAGLNPKSIFLSMVFMGFCHSLIEDTLIAIAFGGHWSGVFVGRIVVAILLILPISYCILKMPDRIFHSLLFKANKDIPDQKTEK